MSGLFDEEITIPKPSRKSVPKGPVHKVQAPNAKVIPTTRTENEQNIIDAVEKFRNAGMIT